MKKRILLMLVMTVVLVLALAVAVSADSVHAGKVDLNQKVTLSDGTECALFDAEGNALIWYVDEDGEYQSIRADIGIAGDEKVDYVITAWNGGGGIQGKPAQQIDDVYITANGKTYDAYDIVVFNIMDDDVVVTTSLKGDYLIGKPVNCMQNLFNIPDSTTPPPAILEYAFLRLDTVALQINVFSYQKNLKYVNIEDLSELVQIEGNTFRDCTSLGPEITIPSSVNKLGNLLFRGCTNLTTVRLGSSVKSLSNYDVLHTCSNLDTVYISGTLTNVPVNTFLNTNNITKIFYVGTEEQANSFIASAAKSGGNGVIATLELISYTNYKAKVASGEATGKYFVYDYSYCEAFNKGVHTLDPEKSNPCAGVCSVCGETAVSANPVHDYVTTITYDNFLAVGVKTQTCSHEGCQYADGTPYVTKVNAIIKEFKGISTKIEGDGLTFGYIINYDALDEYVEVNGTEVELGFVVAVQAFLDGKQPLEASGNVIKATVYKSYTEEGEEKAVRYTGADFKLTGTWDQMVDLDKDGEKETDIKNVVFCMAGYIIDGENASYINAGGSGAAADYITYNTIVNAGNPPATEDSTVTE